MFSDKNGVSAYISQMEQKDSAGRMQVPEWGADYKQLKHCRWLRSQLAHEDVYGICEEEDLVFLEQFHDRIIGGVDPLVVLRRKQTEQTRNEQTYTSSITYSKQTETNTVASPPSWVGQSRNTSVVSHQKQPEDYPTTIYPPSQTKQRELLAMSTPSKPQSMPQHGNGPLRVIFLLFCVASAMLALSLCYFDIPISDCIDWLIECLKNIKKQF